MRIRNFAKFQHFKDRMPPWVKLYRDILDDPDWHELDPEAAKVLVMLWLIASEDESKQGNLPEIKKLAFRLRIEQKRLEKVCIKLSHWLEQDDINTISIRYQSDAPERAGEETETETYKPETETDKRAPRFDAQAHLVSIGIDPLIASDWITHRKAKKAAITITVIDGINREAIKAGMPLADVLAACCQRGWIGFKAEWIAEGNNSAFSDKRQERDSAFLSAIGMSPRNTERVITGEVLP